MPPFSLAGQDNVCEGGDFIVPEGMVVMDSNTQKAVINALERINRTIEMEFEALRAEIKKLQS